jgi:hypothetical protein
MIERGKGAIVNVGSINGVVGMNGAALCGATKAARTPSRSRGPQSSDRTGAGQHRRPGTDPDIAQ